MYKNNTKMYKKIKKFFKNLLTSRPDGAIIKPSKEQSKGEQGNEESQRVRRIVRNE